MFRNQRDILRPKKKATCILSNFKIEVSVPKVKGKAIPVQTWTGPEGSMRFRLPDFKTIGTRRW
jgi:hypothetical protein